MYKVEFVSLEESSKDLIVSFAIEDPKLRVRSLILHRQLFFEEFLDEEEQGVNVTMEGIIVGQEQLNILKQIIVKTSEIEIKSVFSEYQLDISGIEASTIEEMVSLLEKQNYDHKFIIQVT